VLGAQRGLDLSGLVLDAMAASPPQRRRDLGPGQPRCRLRGGGRDHQRQGVGPG
jgi:hypothetical protein